MIVAYMRSGAITYIHPYIDRPDIRYRVKWFRAHPDAQHFPLPHTFGWDQWRERRGLDQFPGFESDYVYDKGHQLPLPPGQNYCGSADQWLNGCLSTDPVPAVDPITGFPVCCQGVQAPLRGGQAFGGQVYGRMAETLHGGVALGGRALGPL